MIKSLQRENHNFSNWLLPRFSGVLKMVIFFVPLVEMQPCNLESIHEILISLGVNTINPFVFNVFILYI